jgi:hypothetical protein
MTFAEQLRDVEKKARSPFDSSARTKFGRGGPVNPVLGGLAILGLAYVLDSPVPALLGAAAYWVTRKPNP